MSVGVVEFCFDGASTTWCVLVGFVYRELLESVPLSSHVTRSVLDIVQNLLANPDKDADISVLSSVLESCLISCSESELIKYY